MAEIIEQGLRFVFPDGWQVTKYDEWTFYRKQFARIHNYIKAVDIVALSPDNTAWLIEVKDYRHKRRTKTEDLAEEMAQKALFTLAAFLPAKLNAALNEEQKFADAVLRAAKIRVVLHLEQSPRHWLRVADPAEIVAKLKNRLRAVDAHPKVFDSGAKIAWEVRSTR
jgi:hypothetical protein